VPDNVSLDAGEDDGAVDVLAFVDAVGNEDSALHREGEADCV